MQFKTILLPTDFSAPALAAAAQGIELAQREKAKVIALHVLPLTELTVGDMPGNLLDEMMQQMQLDAEQQLAMWAGVQPVAVEPLVLWGTPAADICRIAEERKADVIVMATHGRTGLAHLFIGSVAERVVRHAPCSVLVLREQGNVAKG